MEIGAEDVPRVAEQVRRRGNREAWRMAASLCPDPVPPWSRTVQRRVERSRGASPGRRCPGTASAAPRVPAAGSAHGDIVGHPVFEVVVAPAHAGLVSGGPPVYTGRIRV